MEIKRGTTRITILIGKYAVKIPVLNRSLKHFAKGWLGNIDERDLWNSTKNEKLCPIYFSLFGLVNVMCRVSTVYYLTFNKQEMLTYFSDIGTHVDVCSGWKNFGYIDYKLVIVDYAQCRESSDECSDCDNECILKA